MGNILIKVVEKKYIKSKTCSRCKKHVVNMSIDVYYKRVNKKDNHNYIYVCENCLKDSDYITFNSGYYPNIKEVFNFIQYSWNIDQMYKYAIENKFEIRKIPTKSIKDWISSNFIRIDKDNLKNVDMSKSCIMANLSQTAKSSNLIVDGNHRCYKAIEEGLEYIDFYCFDFREQLKFLINTDFDIVEGLVRSSLKKVIYEF